MLTFISDEEEDFQDKDLVYCQQTGDTLRRVETCYAGCIEAPAGQSDYCARKSQSFAPSLLSSYVLFARFP